VETAEKLVKDLGQDLADERARCEELERQAAAFQEKEQAAKLATEEERQARLKDPTYRELEKRALAAEAEAEESHQMLQRWKEWGDEQQLRELTAETERLEKLKEVREDVTRQVEAARKELVDENRALQHKLLELENGPGGSATQELLEEREKQLADQAAVLARYSDRHKDLEAELQSLRKRMEVDSQRHEDQQGKLEETCRSLEARAARAEADASVAADEFADQREQFEAQQRALSAQHEKALKSELISSKELEGKGHQLSQLNKAMSSSRATCVGYRWQLLADALTQMSQATAQEEVFGQVRKVASRWRAEAKTRGIDTERVVRQDLEVERLDQENEKLKDQNRQVLVSLQMQQQDLQIALAETRRLSEREAAYERDVLQLSERSAELGGHANPKQKIKHLVSVKEENQSLRQELKRGKQVIAQLEGQLRAAQFFETAASQPMNEPSTAPQLRPRTPSRRTAQPQQPMTPGRPPASTPGPVKTPAGSESTPAPDDRSEHLRHEKAEHLRHARAHRRASERAANEYQHLYALVERALALGSIPSAASPGHDTHAETPSGQSGDVNVSARAHADHSELYRRLRQLSMNFSAGSDGTEVKACSVVPSNASPEGSGLQTPKGKTSAPEPEEEASVSRGLGRPCDDCLPHLDSLV